MTVHAADASIHVDVDRVNADETKRLTFAPRKSKHSDSFRKGRGRSRRRPAWPSVKLHVSIPE